MWTFPNTLGWDCCVGRFARSQSRRLLETGDFYCYGILFGKSVSELARIAAAPSNAPLRMEASVWPSRHETGRTYRATADRLQGIQ